MGTERAGSVAAQDYERSGGDAHSKLESNELLAHLVSEEDQVKGEDRSIVVELQVDLERDDLVVELGLDLSMHT